MIQIPVKSTPFNLANYLHNVDTTQLSQSEVVLQCYPSGSAMNVLLPSSTFGNGSESLNVTIAAVDGAGGAITVTGSGGDLINGAATYVLTNGGSHYASANVAIVASGVWVAGLNS